MGSAQQGCCLKSEPETWVLDSMHAWSFSSRFWPIPAQAWGCNIHIEIGSSSRTHCWMNKQFILKLDPCDGGMFNFDRTHTNCVQNQPTVYTPVLGWTSCLDDTLRHITMERQRLVWWIAARPCVHPLLDLQIIQMTLSRMTLTGFTH